MKCMLLQSAKFDGQITENAWPAAVRQSKTVDDRDDRATKNMFFREE